MQFRSSLTYAFVALSHPTLGRPLVKALAYGSSIPEIDPADLTALPVPRLGKERERDIAQIAERASALPGKADLLETEIASNAEGILNALRHGDTPVVAVT